MWSGRTFGKASARWLARTSSRRWPREARPQAKAGKFACWGECPKNRLIRTRDGEPGLNYLCSGLLKFWQHIDPDMKQIMQRVELGGTTADLWNFRV